MVVTTTQCAGLILSDRGETNSVVVSIASPAAKRSVDGSSWRGFYRVK